VTALAQAKVTLPYYTGLLDFIIEREAIRVAKEGGKSPPWTRDAILQDWSFTNIDREHDRVTRWITEHWRTPHANDPDLWFAMVVARFVNWPSTLNVLGYPVPWKPEHFLKVMAGRKASRVTVYGPAYMIRADNKDRGTPTAEYQVAKVFNPLWQDRARLRPRQGDTLAAYFARLSPYHGLGGGFMTGQVIADLKYVEPLRSAPDWWSWAVSGPGSRRGLNRALGRPVNAPWSEREWHTAFDRLRADIKPALKHAGIRLHAQNLQHVLCEYDKYERVRLGEGFPKRRYFGARGGFGF
jgi:hypothetical protein